jgi:hypothetical protein
MDGWTKMVRDSVLLCRRTDMKLLQVAKQGVRRVFNLPGESRSHGGREAGQSYETVGSDYFPYLFADVVVKACREFATLEPICPLHVEILGR